MFTQFEVDITSSNIFLKILKNTRILHFIKKHREFGQNLVKVTPENGLKNPWKHHTQAVSRDFSENIVFEQHLGRIWSSFLKFPEIPIKNDT